MMWYKFPLIFLAFFIAALAQVSFLPHFTIGGISSNLVFILFAVVIFYECILNRLWPREFYKEIIMVVMAGFFADIFSPLSFGLSIVIFLALYLVIKILIYFLKEIPDKYLMIYFTVIFAICFSLYGMVMGTFSAIVLAYHIILAAIVFYGYKKIASIKTGRQLKLFH